MKLSDDDLTTLVLQEYATSYGSSTSYTELNNNREMALHYYNASSDEEISNIVADDEDAPEGSTVVSRDVGDVVDSMLSQLMPMFSSASLVQFEALDDEDQDQARVESDIINNLVMEGNKGFTLINTAIMDCLISKNAVIKVRVSEDVTSNTEKYENLTKEELVTILQPKNKDQALDIVKFDEAKGNLTLKRVDIKRSLECDNVAPENFGITSNHGSVDVSDTDYCWEREYITRGELLTRGYSKDKVMTAPAASMEDSMEALARNSLNIKEFYSTNPTLEVVEIYNHYINVDRNSDGERKIYHVVTAENNNINIAEVDVIPYAAGVAFLKPHSHYGVSIYDKQREVQDTKTHFLRQWADNALVNNHNKTDVIEDEVVMDDFTTARPTAVRRVETMNSAREVPTNDIGPSCQSALDYWDKIRTDRSGATLGLQSNNIQMPSNVGDQGVNVIVQHLERVTALVSKTFSETLITSLYQLVHHTLRTQFPNKISARLAGNFIDEEPCEWRERKLVNITIPPTPTEKLMNKLAIEKAINMAREDMAAGLTGITIDLKALYQMRIDVLRMSGIDRPEKYLIDPASKQSMQAQQEASQVKQQQESQAEAERQQDKQFMRELQIEQMRIAGSEVERNLRNDIEQLQFDYAELEAKLKKDYVKIDVDSEQATNKISSDADIAYTRMTADNVTKIVTKSLQHDHEAEMKGTEGMKEAGNE